MVRKLFIIVCLSVTLALLSVIILRIESLQHRQFYIVQEEELSKFYKFSIEDIDITTYHYPLDNVGREEKAVHVSFGDKALVLVENSSTNSLKEFCAGIGKVSQSSVGPSQIITYTQLFESKQTDLSNLNESMLVMTVDGNERVHKRKGTSIDLDEK